MNNLPDTSSPLALYVHWPFCKAKCPYCDFNSHVREAVDHLTWRNAMLVELRHMAALLGPRRVTSVFFGGGTPSLMEPATVQAVLEEADKLWGLDQNVEITLEANPTSTEANKFKSFKSAGINRVSVGIQSLHDADLKALGRQHSADEGRAAIATAASIFDRYSFDLIYARSDQTVEAWEAELTDALSMAGDHLSLYQLTIEPGTQFHTLHASGRLIVPDEDVSADMYEVTQALMKGAGMPAYEVSNHAKQGCESRHNLTYWRYGEYVGIGPGAHGRMNVDGVRHATRTHRAPEEWLRRVQEEGHGYHPFEVIDDEAIREERLMMGLRLSEGVAFANLSEQWPSRSKIKMFQDEGLLEPSDTHLVTTHAGRLVLTRLSGELIG